MPEILTRSNVVVSAIIISFFVIYLVFLRLYLTQTARQFKADFKSQNTSEILGLDTFKLASRLNALTSTLNWVCIDATLSNKTFYKQMKSKNCKTGILQEQISIEDESVPQLKIHLTLRLAKILESGALVFLVFQVIILYAFMRLSAQQIKLELKYEATISELAQKLAHDIRSPLGALNIVSKNLFNTDSAEKSIFENSIHQINGIAESLLIQTRAQVSMTKISTTNIKSESWNVSATLLNLLDEKRILSPHISFQTDLPDEPIFAIFDRVEFQRTISNILNNSIEACESRSEAQVQISLRNYSVKWQVSIMDNGKGIPKNILNTVGQKGLSFEKTHGTGLGLYLVKQFAEANGGYLEIQSDTDVGTLLTLTFNKTI